MEAFEVLVNGVRVCTVGVPHNGVASVIVSHFSPGSDDRYMLRAGGLDVTTREYIHWDFPPLSFGDEITIRLVDTESVDDPAHRQPAFDG